MSQLITKFITDLAVTNAKVASGLDAVKIGAGAVSNTEFGFLDGVTSAIQTQINSKQASGNYITALTGDVTASGPGSSAATIAANAITTSKILADAVTGAKIRLNNDEILRARNAANSADIDILRVNPGNFVHILDGGNHISIDATSRILVDENNVVSVTYLAGQRQLNFSTAQDPAVDWTSEGITKIGGDLQVLPGAQSAIAGKLFLYNDAGNQSLSMQAPAALAASYSLIMPSDDGTSNQVLTTDGSGNLSWTTPAADTGITQLTGDVTAGPGSGSKAATVAKIQGTTVSGTTGSGNVVFSASPTLTGTITAAAANFSGAISASNFSGSSSGTNTGDQTITLTGDVTGSGTGSFAATIAANAVSNAKFRQSVALSVVGNSTNATANVADISAASDFQIMRRSGTALAFGSIDLSQSGAVGSSILPIANGGTNASSASSARSNLGAAASGANSDITSLSGLSTPLSVAQGGTGDATLTANNLLVGAGTSAVTFIAPGTSGNVLTSNGTTWSSAAPSANATNKKERFSLSGTDITNQYLDLTQVAKTDSIHFLVKGAGALLEGASDDYSVSYTGGAGGKTRITFLNDLATGGNAALIAADIVQIVYSY